MSVDPALLHDRLSELVACLTGSPERDARDAIEQSVEQRSEVDALQHVATAVIYLRADRQQRLVGSSA